MSPKIPKTTTESAAGRSPVDSENEHQEEFPVLGARLPESAYLDPPTRENRLGTVMRDAMTRDRELRKVITERDQALAEPSRTYDRVTKLPRSEILESDLKKLVERENHKAPDDPRHLALICGDAVDLTGFNHAFAHSGGDLYLKFIADQLSGFVRTPIDRVYRWGGDEFAVVINDITSEEMEELNHRVEIEFNDAFHSDAFPVPQILLDKMGVRPGIRLASRIYNRDPNLNMSSEDFLSGAMDAVKPADAPAIDLEALKNRSLL